MHRKIGQIIIAITFWILLFGLLGGLELIKSLCAGIAVWFFVIIRQGIILMLIAIPIYLVFLIYKHLKSSK